MGEREAMPETQRSVLGIKLDGARKLSVAIRGTDVSKAGTWADVIDGATFVLPWETVKACLGVSGGTLDRWASGQTPPDAGDRARMRETLAAAVDAWADETEARLAGADPLPGPGM